MSEIMRFKSHIDGKNADVAIHSDHIEWALEGRLGSRGKLALGAATGGLSLLKTGVGGKAKGSEVIPIRSISSVATKKDGMRFTAVQVMTSGNTIDFRCGHAEAEQVKQTLLALINGSHPAQQPPPPPVAPAAAALPPPPPAATAVPATAEPTLMDKLRELAELRDAGVLDEAEFTAAKAKLLA